LPAATLHLARTICRRAERDCVALGAGEEVRSELIAYMNRLSDLLFVMARVATVACGAQEIAWRGRSR
jgi:cob(I)alamin adenosyltransferase